MYKKNIPIFASENMPAELCGIILVNAVIEYFYAIIVKPL